MGDNVTLMLESLILPVTMMLTALFIWKFPAEFRGLFAYHTVYAEKSPATWAAAQYYFGKVGFFSNLAALVLSIAAYVPVFIIDSFESKGGVVCMIVTMVQVAVVFVDMFATEGMLKKHFDRDGNPKQ